MTTTVTLSDAFFHEIGELARARGTTVEAQIAELLAKALAHDAREAELLAEIRKERDEMAQKGLFLTDDFIAQAKSWGRK